MSTTRDIFVKLVSEKLKENPKGFSIFTEKNECIGVVLRPEQYQLLQAAAELVSESEELFALLLKNNRFQEGIEPLTKSMEQIFVKTKELESELE